MNATARLRPLDGRSHGGQFGNGDIIYIGIWLRSEESKKLEATRLCESAGGGASYDEESGIAGYAVPKEQP